MSRISSALLILKEYYSTESGEVIPEAYDLICSLRFARSEYLQYKGVNFEGNCYVGSLEDNSEPELWI